MVLGWIAGEALLPVEGEEVGAGVRDMFLASSDKMAVL